MALPRKLDVPTYNVQVPSSGEFIKIRPFTVKEEKILLMAIQSNETEDIVNATKQIINNCILTENFNSDLLRIYDFEYIFVQLRIHSVGEKTTIRFSPRDPSVTDCKKCLQPREVEIDLREAKIKKFENHTNKIELTKTLGLIMKYPDMTLLNKLEIAQNSNNVNDVFQVIWLCIESLYDEEATYQASDSTLNEGVDWLESLQLEQFKKIEKFFDTIPVLEQTVLIKCDECNHQEDYTLEGLESFFG